MPVYLVGIKEVWVQQARVTAKTKEEAKRKVLDGDGEYLDGPQGFEFQYSIDSKDWVVEKE